MIDKSTVGALAIVLVLATWINVAATYQLSRSESYSAVQKYYQKIFVWCVPIFGAGTVLFVIWSDRSAQIHNTREQCDAEENNSILRRMQSFLLLDFHAASSGVDKTVVDHGAVEAKSED